MYSNMSDRLNIDWEGYKSRVIKSKLNNTTMKDEFIVSKIEASSQDEKSPFVYVEFTNTKSPAQGKQQQQSPFGGMGMNFTSPEDLMKNFSKMFGSGEGRGINSGESPTSFKLSIREYEESGLRVGDKVTIEIKKSDSSGI